MFNISNPQRWSLLTGAGFSASWGGLLASQVWAELVSNPLLQEREGLRGALLTDSGFDFEELLYRAQKKNEFDSGSREALEEAIGRVYDYIESVFIADLFRVSQLDLSALLSEFHGTDNSSGYIFTLNQDMLLERLFWYGHGSHVQRPGVNKPTVEYAVAGWNHARENGADPGHKVTVPGLSTTPPAGWPEAVSGTSYIKLHGSWDWRSDDGSEAMVLGGGKLETIEQRPLLKFYFDVFRSFLNHGDRRLLIIGYGFRDEHVNIALANAVERHGLRLHIWDVQSPYGLISTLKSQSGGETIWKGLCGFTQIPVVNLFPRNDAAMQQVSDAAIRQIDRIFGKDVRNAAGLLPRKQH